MRILIVDQAPDQHTRLIEDLKNKSHDVLVARDGKEALDCFRKHYPQLIIAEDRLPDLSVVQFLSAFDQQSVRPKLVLMSDWPVQSRHCLRDPRINFILQKPFGAEEIWRFLRVKRTA